MKSPNSEDHSAETEYLQRNYSKDVHVHHFNRQVAIFRILMNDPNSGLAKAGPGRAGARPITHVIDVHRISHSIYHIGYPSLLVLIIIYNVDVQHKYFH